MTEKTVSQDLTPEQEEALIAAKEAELNIEEQKKIAREAYQKLKKRLKTQSKNSLIQMLIEQTSNYQQMQLIAKQLLAENKALKGESNAQLNNSTSDATIDSSDAKEE
jgi:hypothetical protein